VDLESGRRTRLTRCQRYRDGAWSPDGSHIAASGTALGQARLDLLTAEGGYLRTLWQGVQGEVLGRLDWSPDGRRLVASLWRPARGWALELFDLNTLRWQAVTHDSTPEFDPRFSADGRALLYSSEHGGVYNLRRMELASGRSETLTNVLGGAFSPTQGAVAGDIYYIGYGAEGYDLYRLPAPHTARDLPEGRGRLLPAPRDYAAVSATATDYAPWTTLLPRSWIPLLAVTEATQEVGAFVWGSDALYLHSYTLQGSYEFSHNLASAAVAYNYADRLGLVARRGYDYSTADGGSRLSRARAVDSLQAVLSARWNSLDRRFAAHLGAGLTREHDRVVAEELLPLPDMNNGFAGLAATFDNSRRHERSVSRNDGRSLRLIGESNAVLGSDYSGEAYTLDWREYIRLGGEHVLALRAVQGWGTEQPRPYRLGGSGSLVELSEQGLFDRRSYPLRGYSEIVRGRRMRLLSAEWRFPLMRPERGFVRVPLGLQQLSGRAFVDSGNTWNSGGRPQAMRTGIGAEVLSDLSVGYRLGAQLRLGLARGLDEGGETRVYLLVGLPL
jgi:hypothetical protein